jgi:hypothetical protein
MTVDAFPIVPADEVALSVLCRNSLTDAEVKLARAALRGLDPAWSLECCESCEGDWFLDLSSARPVGRFDRFIFHARDGAVHMFGMAEVTTSGWGASPTWCRPRVPPSRRSQHDGGGRGIGGRGGGGHDSGRRDCARGERYVLDTIARLVGGVGLTKG